MFVLYSLCFIILLPSTPGPAFSIFSVSSQAYKSVSFSLLSPKGKPRDTVILYACLLLNELQAEDKRNNFIPYPHMCKNAARKKKINSGLFTSLDKTQQIKPDLLCQTSGYLNRQAVAKLEKACTTTQSELGFHYCSW